MRLNRNGYPLRERHWHLWVPEYRLRSGLDPILGFCVIFRAGKCGRIKRKLPYNYLQHSKKRVHVPHHVITRSSWLLSARGESIQGNHCHYGLCNHFEYQLSRLPTGLVSSLQYLYPFTNDAAIERTTSPSAVAGAKGPLF